MKKEKLLRASLVLSSAAFIVSLFSLILTYGLFLEVKGLVPYIKPQPTLSPTTAIFPSTFIGRFILVASPSIIAAIISIVILIVLIFIFRKS